MKKTNLRLTAIFLITLTLLISSSISIMSFSTDTESALINRAETEIQHNDNYLFFIARYLSTIRR